MKYDSLDSLNQSEDPSTFGFVDIQFGLVAVLLLALASSISSLSGTSSQLRSSGVGADFLLNELRCGSALSNGSDEGAGCFDTFDGHNNSEIYLFQPKGESVVVLGYKPIAGESPSVSQQKGVFGSGKILLPTSIDLVGVTEIPANRDAFYALRTRMNTLLPCFAPLDYDLNLEIKALKSAVIKLMSDCQTKVFPASERFFRGRFSGKIEDQHYIDRSVYAGIDRIVVEGHSDGLDPKSSVSDEKTQTNSRLASQRAQRVLLSLLDPDIRGNPFWVEYHLDQVAKKDSVSSAYSSALLGLVPLKSRLVNDCKIYLRNSTKSLIDQKSGTPVMWCLALIDEFVDVPISIETVRTYLPRIFAVSSYGRFSLRHGVLTDAKTKAFAADRRVEFRFVPTIIPQQIFELVELHGNRTLYDLFTARAVTTIYNCDLNGRGGDENCVLELDRMVNGSL